jgi:hypothetical protein
MQIISFLSCGKQTVFLIANLISWRIICHLLVCEFVMNTKIIDFINTSITFKLRKKPCIRKRIFFSSLSDRTFIEKLSGFFNNEFKG